ncbi:MAG: prepilin-type N-terminal cleavage/methylation domain-containing protein [Planctomycetes bacterium]|nr:prepilin-type N-terminal cleavage/methylation domain-containing protein [Planctomycetota bacterium]
MTCRGMTLLEVVLATALMAVVVAAASGWIAGQARAGRVAQKRLEGVQALAACVRAIDDDLVGAIGLAPWSVDETDGLRLETLHCAPGDPAGIHGVHWRFADGALVRDSGGAIRIASQRLVEARFARDERAGGVQLVARVCATGDEIAIPLRAGRRP